MDKKIKELDLREDAHKIIDACIREMQPGDAVKRALKGKSFRGDIYLLAIGKAAWQMANAAYEALDQRLEQGVVITKYGHSKGPIGKSGAIEIYEAGHPIPDNNTYLATKTALDMVSLIDEEDTLLLLLSGGGSVLFEKPLIDAEELQDINQQLLASGADINEINTIRKRLSAVKGGRLAEKCRGEIIQIVLSDVIGDRVDAISSGPAAPDRSTCEEALEIANRYGLNLSDEALRNLSIETPKNLANVDTAICGNVRLLCESAARSAESLGYRAEIVADSMTCEALEAGKMLAGAAVEHADEGIPLAYIFGGETVVHVKGSGKGGRNQEIALAAAERIEGLDNVLIFSFGSDGTDGPTDAAGGMVDGSTAGRLRDNGISISEVLDNNDSYNALESVDALIITGPTGTNVNDVSVVLIEP